jgi:hypothetical protein
MSQARYCKMNQHFDQALSAVDAVLAEAPDYPEAFFLKLFFYSRWANLSNLPL